MIGYACIAGTILLTIYGQLVLYWRVAGQKIGASGFSWTEIMRIVRTILDPWVLSGFAAAFLASVCYLIALSRFQINHAYPFMSLTFPLVSVCSFFIFGDAPSNEEDPWAWVDCLRSHHRQPRIATTSFSRRNCRRTRSRPLKFISWNSLRCAQVITCATFGLIYAFALTFLYVEGDDARTVVHHVLGAELISPFSAYHGMMDRLLAFFPDDERILRVSSIALSSGFAVVFSSAYSDAPL